MAVIVLAVGVSLDGGASGLTTRSVAGILVWWAVLLAVAFSVWPAAAVPRPAVAAAALLGAFTAFTGLSTLWAPSAETAFQELDRASLYLGVFAVALMAPRRATAQRWIDGLAAAAALVALLALAQRLLPGLLPEGDVQRLLPSAGTRLSYPIGYWNGLAIMLALGIPLLLRLAASPARPWIRGLAVAGLPAVASAMYLTSSRGGVVVGVVGAAVFLATTARRFAALQALVVAAGGAAIAIAVLTGHPALVDGPPGSPAAEDEGPGVAALLLLVSAGSGALYTAVAALAPPRILLPRAAAAALIAAIVVAGGAGLAAADPAERIRDFKAPPAASTYDDEGFVQSHLFSGAGTGRWQFWEAAVDQFEADPVVGGGAGSYAVWWAEHGSIRWFLRNAHSLWLETLGELGLIGFVLLAGAFGTVLGTGALRLRRRSDEDRTIVAALLATAVAFAVGAGIDWIWQVPAIALFGVVCLGLLVGPAATPAAHPVDADRRAPGSPTRSRRRFGLQAAVVLVAWAAIAAQAIPLLVASELDASRSAASRGDLAAAAQRADSARAIQPWAASPYLQLALLREQQGDLAAARAEIGEALDRDRADWRLHLVAARLATKSGDIAAARRALLEARRLNPRSPIFSDRE